MPRPSRIKMVRRIFSLASALTCKGETKRYEFSKAMILWFWLVAFLLIEVDWRTKESEAIRAIRRKIIVTIKYLFFTN